MSIPARRCRGAAGHAGKRMGSSRSIIVVLACLIGLAVGSAVALSSCRPSAQGTSSAASASAAAATSPADAAASQPSASPTSPGSTVTAPAWDLQFQVSAWLTQSSGVASSGAGAVLFNSGLSASEGGLVVLACGGAWSGDASAMTTLLNDPEKVLALLPGGQGENGQLAIRRAASATTIGRQSWPAVSGEYTVTLAPDKEPLFGQRIVGLEVFLFPYGGQLYELALVAAPEATFQAHRSDLELTPTTLEPMNDTTSPSATPSPGQTTPPADATTTAVIAGVHTLQAGLQSWALDHGGVYPDPSLVTQTGLGRPYVDTWPTNPLTHGPMLPSGGPGNYTYQVLDGGHSFTLVGFGADGTAVVTVP